MLVLVFCFWVKCRTLDESRAQGELLSRGLFGPRLTTPKLRLKQQKVSVQNGTCP